MKKKVTCLFLLCILFSCTSCAPKKKTAIKVLILPKFEIGEMTGDMPGEAQHYYEGYLADGEVYEIAGRPMYVKDGAALYVTDMGKTNCGISVASVLTDERFDFSNAYLLSVGVAGSSVENTVMGDVVVTSSVVDYDLGHHADVREMENPTDTTWFHDAQFENSSYVLLNRELTDKVYELVKDIPLETTELTREYMREAFDGAAWAIRDPAVLKGTAVTGDNYWKGKYDHANAVLLTKYYGAPDPYMVTEMEEISVAVAAKRLGMLDRLIILRTSVNMDEFVLGDTPERLWGRGDEESEFINSRKSDIFETALMNSYKVGRRIIETILEGKLRN